MSKLRWFDQTNVEEAASLIDTTILNDIVIDGTCTHVFRIPFSYSKLIKSASVSYKQSLTVVLTKPVLAANVQETPTCSYIYIQLSPQETRVFADTVLDTTCQLKLVTIDDKVLFSNKYNINIIQPIEPQLLEE